MKENEYKCIACGYVKESKKICSCDKCGYKMLSMPYDRKEVLISEIRNFINSLMPSEIDTEKLDYFRTKSDNKAKKAGMQGKIKKSEDEKRFPSYGKIQNYICSADVTEKFFSRLNEAIDKTEDYISTPFCARYATDFKTLAESVKKRDVVLASALDCFNESIELENIEFPETYLNYSEIPNEEILAAAKSLINSVRKLTEKIGKFIRRYNVYGDTYKEQFAYRKEIDKNTDYLAYIVQEKKNVEKILEIDYQIDIFSDGKHELKEMLQVLWQAIGTVRNSPIFEKTKCFETDGRRYSVTEFSEKLIGDINERYASLFDIVLSPFYFEDFTEDELFEFYGNLLELGENIGSDKNIGEYEKELEELIGLTEIKKSIKKIKAYAAKNKESENLNLHMCFYGNPGTGKTEVARIIAGILYENDILPTKNVIEVDRSDLVGQYMGETSQKTMRKIKEAMGGVLFIDEAYALAPNGVSYDYGHEAIATLIKAMEDFRGKFCVILAGYKNQMVDMISTNPGFKSRIQFELEFPNYSRDELKDIAQLMLKKRNYTVSDSAMQKILDITDVKRREANFANAREIRNILDGVIMCQNLRNSECEKEIGTVDVDKYIKDARINLSGGEKSFEILTAEEKLNALIGLDNVKRTVKKIKAFAKKNKNEQNFNMHMCFYGNPGTGKTEVARIISSILYEAGVLREAKIIETDSHGLIGKYVGETAPKTQTKISDAMGGVLFIDEAYGLTNSEGGVNKSYGEEAIEVLLKNMEDFRGKFCVIFAGYKDEIKSMLASNPGLESRIQFALEFPDYTRDEFGQIAVKFLEKKKYTMDAQALELLLDVTEYYRQSKSFANARTVRNILDQVIMNQNLRTEDSDNDNRIIIKSDVEEYISDEGINIKEKSAKTHRIGFGE